MAAVHMPAARAGVQERITPFIGAFDPVVLENGKDTSDKGRTVNSPRMEEKEEERSLLAKALRVPVDIVENIDLFRFIKDWYRTPYRFGGTQRSGIDCSAFTQKLYKEIYDKALLRVVSLQRKQVLPVDKSSLIQGDLLFFHTTRPGLSHVGVYLGGGLFIHASVSKGVTIDNLGNPYYAKAFRTGGRFIDVNGYIEALLFH
jgi:lipoprotein Spr